MAKSKPKPNFIGTWHIVSMSTLDENQLNEEIDAFVEFDEHGGGSFQFGEIHGFIDHYRTKKKDRQRAVQFSWCGEYADGSPLDDIGWAMLEGDELRGTISLNAGEEDVEFMAKRASQKSSATRHDA